MLWKLAEHTEEENRRWCWMRTVEWCAWPLFVSPAVYPAVAVLSAPRTLLVSLVASGWVWALIRYRLRGCLTLRDVGCVIVVFLKWPAGLGLRRVVSSGGPSTVWRPFLFAGR